MRILHVIRSDGFGGVENYVARLAAAQRTEGHDVVIIGGDQARMLLASGIPTDRLVPATTTYAAGRAVRREIRRHPTDIVHAHMTAAEVGSILALLDTRIPLVVTRHFAQRRGRSLPIRLAASLLARRISAQIAVSRFVADSVEGDTILVPPGVPQRASDASLTHRRPIVLVAQRLEPEKHSEDALTIFASSGLPELGWRLQFAGDGSCRPELELLAAQRHLTAVDFLGHRTDLPTLMERSAILLATCPTEHFGLTVVEAMAHALPVVATAAAGHLETVGTVSRAELYAVGDMDEGARHLARLAADENLRDRYGEDLRAAQQQQFTIAAQMRAVQDVYARLV